MRILADIADVKELKKAFKNNEDIHRLTASQVFNVPINKVNEDLRRKAKTIILELFMVLRNMDWQNKFLYQTKKL